MDRHEPVVQTPPAPVNSATDSTRCDVVVIGGGIVGMATAMALLQQFRIRLAVVEAEDRLAAHQTGHNSGVIHSGLYYKPGSLKARLCAEGREAMYAFCQEHGVPHERCGKVVVATRESELPALNELERRGRANGLNGMLRLTGAQLREYEPHVSGIEGLYVPQTGIVDYKAVTRAYGEVVARLGGDVRMTSAAKSVRSVGGGLVVQTTRGDIECRGIVNCAGLQSDRVARMCGIEPDVRIIPFRGEYYELVPQRATLVRNLIYPVPDARFPFLGVHFTRMIGGGVEAGPNAVLALARHGYGWSNISPGDVASTATFPGFWRMARRYWKTGFGEVHRSLSKRAFLAALRRLIPGLNLEDLKPGGSGVRAQAVERSGALVDDFRIKQSENMVHVLNAPSPGATASISIGRYIAETAAQPLGLVNR